MSSPLSTFAGIHSPKTKAKILKALKPFTEKKTPDGPPWLVQRARRGKKS